MPWMNSTIECGHCHTAYSTDGVDPKIFIEGEDVFILQVRLECSACGETNFFLQFEEKTHENPSKNLPSGLISIYPFLNTRPQCPPKVPPYIAEDYIEACMVLPISPKASAALSRRCLQNLLRDAGKVKPQNRLANEIEEVIKQLPSYIADSLQAIRHIGNIAAHPEKNVDVILPIETNEANWCLDILEALFDFYYVRPEKDAERRSTLNSKFHEAGKEPPMKQ